MSEWHFTSHTTRLPEFAAPNLRSRNSLATVDAELPAMASGVLYALGGGSGGISLYLDKGILSFEYNAMVMSRTKLHASRALAAGHHVIEVATRMASAKPGASASITLKVDGVEVAQGATPFTPPLTFTASETFDVGMDLGSPVSLDYFDRAPFKFPGGWSYIMLWYFF